MLSNSVASEIATAIVKHQTEIIGPLATQQASKVKGVIVSQNSVQIPDANTDPQQILIELVDKYAQIFGNTSIEVCKDALREANITISTKDLPLILQ